MSKQNRASVINNLFGILHIKHIDEKYKKSIIDGFNIMQNGSEYLKANGVVAFCSRVDSDLMSLDDYASSRQARETYKDIKSISQGRSFDKEGIQNDIHVSLGETSVILRSLQHTLDLRNIILDHESLVSGEDYSGQSEGKKTNKRL